MRSDASVTRCQVIPQLLNSKHAPPPSQNGDSLFPASAAHTKHRGIDPLGPWKSGDENVKPSSRPVIQANSIRGLQLARRSTDSSVDLPLTWPNGLFDIDGTVSPMSSRESRSCVFCGGRPVTLEHTFPRWTVPLIKTVSDVMSTTLVSQHEEHVHNVWGTETIDLKARKVCQPCNTGHSKPSITLDVYGQLWDTSQEQLAEKLDAAIRAESPANPGEVVRLSR